MAANLSDSIIKGLPVPADGYAITWDAKVAGFGCRVTAAGARSFILNYRTRGGRARRFTVGSFGDWTTGAARDEARRLKTLIDRGQDPLGDMTAARAAPTVGDLCDRFIREYLPRKKPSTQHTYKLQIESEIRPPLGRLKVAEVTFDDTDGLHRKITARGTPYRANRVIALLSVMFTMAIKWRLRTDNPCQSVQRNAEHKRRRYLSPDELARLTTALANAKDQQSADIVRMLLLTGARRGEVLSAKWDDIDLAVGMWRKPAATTKTRTTHEVPLSQPARALLAAVRERSPKMRRGYSRRVTAKLARTSRTHGRGFVATLASRPAFTICDTPMRARWHPPGKVCRSLAPCSAIRHRRRRHDTHICSTIRCAEQPSKPAQF